MYALVTVIDVGSWALVIVLFVVTFYYVVLYKLQTVRPCSMPSSGAISRRGAVREGGRGPCQVHGVWVWVWPGRGRGARA